MITLIIGGARSGKSRHAQALAASLTPAPVYLATSRPWDAGHRARIERHRRDRGPEWTTREAERQLAHKDLAGRVVVVDCLTLWLTNLVGELGPDVDRVRAWANDELGRLSTIDATWILVTNELGMSIHPATELGRRFVDLQGFVNQDAAALADAVIWMVAGIPVPLRPIRRPEQGSIQ